EKIANRETVILDGATGTELERRGVAMNSAAWSAEAILGSPEVVRVVHEDYIRAGADIITSNSFSLARHMLVRAGLEGQFRRLNADAVKIALKAREGANRPVAVAGSIAPTTFCDDPNLCYPPSADAFAWYREQAEVLAEAGADLLIIEMIEDIRQGSMAVEAALQTGLPVWLGFSCVKNAAGEMMLWEQGHTLREGVEAIAQIGGDAAFIMHTETKDAAEAFAILKSRWQGRIGVYAHSGVFVMPNWLFTDVITPEEYAAEAAKWIEMGAQIVGGCCGIGPEHIRRLQALSA
ncbi:MAG: homocysteine S-methyltransferase family protein, partial [Desulfobulbaceae bacterium]|nr:homocysteine S-methyltransferase family protein [Desulfobulbaceae bacterium]